MGDEKLFLIPVLGEALFYAIAHQLLRPLRLVEIAGGQDKFFSRFEGGLGAFLRRVILSEITPSDMIAAISDDAACLCMLWNAIFKRTWVDDDLHRGLLTNTLQAMLNYGALGGQRSTRAQVLEAIGPIASEGLDPETFTAEDIAETVPIRTMVRVVQLLALQERWMDDAESARRPSVRPPMSRPPPLPGSRKRTPMPWQETPPAEASALTEAPAMTAVTIPAPAPADAPAETAATDDGPEVTFEDGSGTEEPAADKTDDLALDLSELEKAMRPNQ